MLVTVTYALLRNGFPLTPLLPLLAIGIGCSLFYAVAKFIRSLF